MVSRGRKPLVLPSPHGREPRGKGEGDRDAEEAAQHATPVVFAVYAVLAHRLRLPKEGLMMHNIVEGGCYQWPNYTPKPQQATLRWKMWALFLGLFAAGLIGVGFFVLL